MVRNYKRIKGSNLGKRLIEILSTHQSMKGAYFYRPPSTARGRRTYEERNSATEEFKFHGKHYQIEQDTSCSCKNVRYSRSVVVDGVRRDVRAIKSLLK